jgi:hypothetical protein
MSEDTLTQDAGSSPTPIEAIVRHAPHPEQELIMHLEPDQLVTETFRPVPRAVLGQAALTGLWALRVFCVLVSLMVIYTFFDRLH